MNDLEAKLVEALDRLGTVLGRLEATRPVRDAAAGIELDADKVAAKAGKAPETAPAEGWQRIGEIIGAANAKVLAGALGRAQGAGASARSRLGRAAAWVGASRVGRAAKGLRDHVAGSRVGRAAKGLRERVAGSRVGRAAGKVGGAARKVAGKVAGSGAVRILRTVGSKVGSAVGTIVGGRVGGPAGAAVGKVVGNYAGKYAAGAVGEGLKKIDEFTKETEKASQGLMDLNRSVGQFGALMGQLNAEMDARNAMRSREKGDRLESSARFLGSSDQFRKDNTKEGEILWQKVDNYVTAGKNYIAGAVNWPLNKIYGLINRAVEGEQQKINTLGDATMKLGEDLLKEREEAEKRRAEMRDRARKKP